ncbi:hypothetical protein C8J57DRAFT_1712604 [Mycena rebaudengoi]|nr:hypothetical protein C8J57DRAFT_1712604 [Mycena rebaudengoi]
MKRLDPLNVSSLRMTAATISNATCWALCSFHTHLRNHSSRRRASTRRPWAQQSWSHLRGARAAPTYEQETGTPLAAAFTSPSRPARSKIMMRPRRPALGVRANDVLAALRIWAPSLEALCLVCDAEVPPSPPFSPLSRNSATSTPPARLDPPVRLLPRAALPGAQLPLALAAPTLRGLGGTHVAGLAGAPMSVAPKVQDVKVQDGDAPMSHAPPHDREYNERTDNGGREAHCVLIYDNWACAHIVRRAQIAHRVHIAHRAHCYPYITPPRRGHPRAPALGPRSAERKRHAESKRTPRCPPT